MENKTILDSVDPEIMEHMASRRDVLGMARRMALGVAVASVPVAFGALARKAYGQALPQNIIDVLNFALTLEYLEAEFYARAITADGLIPESTQDIFGVIASHESMHVQLLQSVLGSDAVAKPDFDFTAGGAFSPFTDYDQLLVLSQGFEDTGVRAYKGQAANLIENDQILTTALLIHSVEARHAAEIRRIRGQEAWINFDDTDVAALQPIYQGEAQTMQLTVEMTEVTEVNEEKITEAFDEPLTKEEVLAIASMFIAG